MSRRVVAGLAALPVLGLGLGIRAFAASFSLSSHDLTPLRTCVVTATPSTTTSESDAAVAQAASSTNYGTATSMTVQSGSSVNQRVYVEFTLSGCNPAIPSTATVRLATLRLYVTTLPSVCRTLDVFRATATWAETSITWSNQPFGTTPNNPTSSSRSASVGVGSASGCANQSAGYVSGATVTSDVQSFVSGSASNFGWMIRDDSEGSSKTYAETFATKEAATLAESPQLVVSYVTAP